MAFSLTYLGTLTIAGLMFLVQFIAFTALLALAACGQFLTSAAQALRKANTPQQRGRHMSGSGRHTAAAKTADR